MARVARPTKTSVSCPGTPTSLAPGAILTCTASYAVTQADLDVGEVTNHATAAAKFGNTTILSNPRQATVTAVKSPAISLVKSASPLTYNAVGQMISYSYVIKNTVIKDSVVNTMSLSDDKFSIALTRT